MVTSFIPLFPLAYFGLQLSLIDIKSHRLPNLLVGEFLVLEILLMGAISLTTSDVARMADAVGVAVAMFSTYLVLYLVSRGSLGMGDVKFAFPLGLSIGWYSTDYWFASILITFLLAGLVAVIGLASKRIDRKSRLAFGPYMFICTVLVCCLGNLLP